MIYTSVFPSPMGKIFMAGNEEGLLGLWFEGQKYFADALKRSGEATEEKELPLFEETRRWLELYFTGKIPDFLPKLALKGSPFQKAVWAELLKIPYGKTTSYGKIAASIAQKRGLPSMSAQAVGGAVGHNPVSILVPCHRVIGKDGSLTGYAGGLDKKIALLTIEGVLSKELF